MVFDFLKGSLWMLIALLVQQIGAIPVIWHRPKGIRSTKVEYFLVELCAMRFWNLDL